MFSMVLTIFPFTLMMFAGCLIAETGFRGLRPPRQGRVVSAALFILNALFPHRRWGDETAIARREALFLFAFGAMMVFIGLNNLYLAFA